MPSNTIEKFLHYYKFVSRCCCIVWISSADRTHKFVSISKCILALFKTKSLWKLFHNSGARFLNYDEIQFINAIVIKLFVDSYGWFLTVHCFSNFLCTFLPFGGIHLYQRPRGTESHNFFNEDFLELLFLDGFIVWFDCESCQTLLRIHALKVE